MSRNLRALVTKNSMKERFKTAQSYLQKLKFLVEDVSFIFYQYNNKSPFTQLNVYFHVATTFTAGRLRLANCKWKTNCLSSNVRTRFDLFYD